MQHVDIDDVEPSAIGSDIDRRGLSDPLDTEDVAVNYYRLEPGERLSGNLHTHMDQEEVFVVVSGEATFETPEAEVTVAEDQAIRFAPGEYQSGYNDGDAELVVLALGAPRGSRDVRVPQECPECGHEDMRAVPAEDGEGFVLQCPDCEAELSA
jgi:uncharacterized cupin superfamily protein